MKTMDGKIGGTSEGGFKLADSPYTFRAVGKLPPLRVNDEVEVIYDDTSDENVKKVYVVNIIKRSMDGEYIKKVDEAVEKEKLEKVAEKKAEAGITPERKAMVDKGRVPDRDARMVRMSALKDAVEYCKMQVETGQIKELTMGIVKDAMQEFEKLIYQG